MALVAAAAIGAAVPAGASSIFTDLPPLDAAPVLRLDPSAPSRAMGGASGAVFWGDVDGWPNPSLLGLARGLRYDYDNTTMGGGFDYQARRLVLGWGGLGASLAGRPFPGIGGTRLTSSLALEASGLPLEVFELDEQVKSWSVGASVSGLATSIAEMRGVRAPAFCRFTDLALGFGYKDLDQKGALSAVDIGPAMDWGLLVRVGSGFTAFSNSCRADLAYGYSVQNANEVDVSGRFGTVWRPHRHATAARLTLDPPALSTRRAALGLQPLLAAGGAWDRIFVTADEMRVSDETRLGAEIALANVAYIRFGQGQSGSASPSGYGFALPIGRMARVRYDRARVPIQGLPDATTDRWSVWLDPVAIVDAWRRE
jgi:hypothetical protein